MKIVFENVTGQGLIFLPNKSQGNTRLPIWSTISHEEFTATKEFAAGKEPVQKAHSFVTQEDDVAMLKRELRHSSKDWKYAPPPPYPSNVMHLNISKVMKHLCHPL